MEVKLNNYASWIRFHQWDTSEWDLEGQSEAKDILLLLLVLASKVNLKTWEFVAAKLQIPGSGHQRQGWGRQGQQCRNGGSGPALQRSVNGAASLPSIPLTSPTISNVPHFRYEICSGLKPRGGSCAELSVTEKVFGTVIVTGHRLARKLVLVSDPLPPTMTLQPLDNMILTSSV